MAFLNFPIPKYEVLFIVETYYQNMRRTHSVSELAQAMGVPEQLIQEGDDAGEYLDTTSAGDSPR